MASKETTPAPPPKHPTEVAIASIVVCVLFGAIVAKGALMSVRYDPWISPDWRAWSARAESRLGFNAEVGAGGARRLPGLEPGWLFGRANDLSDTQWRSFRGQLPLLALAALVTAPAVAVARRLLGARAMPAFHALYGAAFVSYLHGVRALWIAALILVHHRACRRFAGAPFLGPAVAWASALAALVASQFWAHSWTFARLARIAPPLAPLLPLDDAYAGILPRWWTHFNLVVLRMVSYGVDLHRRRVAEAEAKSAAAAEPATAIATAPTSASASADADEGYFRLVEHPTAEVEHSLTEFVAYCLYPPLYLAGPTATFNAFASQLRAPQRSHGARALVRYAAWKFGLVLLILEVWTHTQYANAMSKFRAWSPSGGTSSAPAFGPFEVASTSLMVLNFMWLKFTVIWRFFRLWSLLSGVEPPENMLRCVNNNCTILGFWRGWHASFNRWLVRYMYVPLGGAKYRLLNVWVIFGFVGAWHDRLAWHLLWWAAIFAAFLAPELAAAAAAARLFPTPQSRESLTYRLIRSFLGAMNVHVLIAGNMVGYVVGMDGAGDLARAYAGGFSSPATTVAYAAFTVAVLGAACHLGFEQRAGEARERLARKGGKGS